jgi:hypothetical protein
MIRPPCSWKGCHEVSIRAVPFCDSLRFCARHLVEFRGGSPVPEPTPPTDDSLRSLYQPPMPGMVVRPLFRKSGRRL